MLNLEVDLVGLCWVLQVHVGPMRSTSVGWLKLKSSDPNDHPIIEPNYLSTGTCSLSLLCQLISCLFQYLFNTSPEVLVGTLLLISHL